MKLSEVSIQRPVFATVMSLAIILFGIVSFLRLPVREYPDIDPPVVSILTLYRGASPSVVETEITDVLEEEIEELRRASETESRIDLARSNVWSERLLGLLGRARERLERLAALRSQGAWEGGRRELETAMTELGAELGRARASITGR